LWDDSRPNDAPLDFASGLQWVDRTLSEEIGLKFEEKTMVGVPGGMQLIILLVIILLLFGKRIPQMMGSLGQGVVEFKKGISGLEDEKEKKSSGEERKSSEEHSSEEVKS
jgi:sec-independent protein translocase protein TatA